MSRNEHRIPEQLTADQVHQAASALDRGIEHPFAESTKFDVIINERRYPPKAVLGVASKLGFDVDLVPGDFTGGLGSKCFRILENLGFQIVTKEGALASHSFIPNRLYNRKRDIHEVYGGQEQSGIVTPKDSPFIFLFTSETGEQYGYRDGWNNEGIFLYTGQGKKGNQEFKLGNKAIRDHAQDGKTLEVFQSLGKGKDCRYLGTMYCASWEIVQAPDEDGNQRQVILFHLTSEVEPDDYHEDTQATLETLKQRALEAAETPRATRTTAIQTVYARSKAVKDYVLRRANGTCESCGQPAPFRRTDGTPYLEPHHTRRLSDDGPDHPHWVAALCPNCHREIHSGQDGDKKNQALITRLESIEGQCQ